MYTQPCVGIGNYTLVASAKPPTRRQVYIALVSTVALLFFLVLLNGVLADPRHMDFAEFYAGGLIIHQGNASRLYDLAEQARVEQRLFNGEKALVNPHPPFEALFFAALVRLSYLKAYLLWGLINAFFWLLFQHLLRPYAPVATYPFRYFLLCALFFPLWAALIRGQTSVLLLLAFSLAYVYLKRGRNFLAGIFLGLGLFKFAVVLPFAFICFLRKKWSLIGGFAVAAFPLGLVSLMTVGPEGLRSYLRLLIAILREPSAPAFGESFRAWPMPTVGGLFATLLARRVSAGHITMLTEVISGTLVLFIAWRWRQCDHERSGDASGLMFAAAVVVSQVTAAHLYVHDLTLMLLPTLLVMGSSQWFGKSSQRAVIVAAMIILYAPPVYVLLLRWKAMYVLAPVLVAFALAAISLARKADLPLAQATPPRPPLSNGTPATQNSKDGENCRA